MRGLNLPGWTVEEDTRTLVATLRAPGGMWARVDARSLHALPEACAEVVEQALLDAAGRVGAVEVVVEVERIGSAWRARVVAQGR